METSPFEEMKWSSENNIFRFQGFSFQNAWGVHSLLLLTQRGGCFWSNFSNWSSLFSPGSISVSDQIHQAAFPSKMAVIKLLNSMEISMTLIRNSMEISTTLAYDTADGMASSSDQQIIIFSTDPPQLQCDFIFFSKKKQFNAISWVMHFSREFLGPPKAMVSDVHPLKHRNHRAQNSFARGYRTLW